MRQISFALALVMLGTLAASLPGQADPKARASAEKHFKPETKRDDFEKSTTTFLPAEELPAYRSKGVECGTASVRLAYSHTTGASDASTAIAFLYVSRDWMFIDKAAPLRVLVGDSVREFPPIGSPSRDPSEGMASESQSFAVTSDDLAWLASLPTARARVSGEKLNCDFPLSGEALALAGLFRERVVR